jgi:hypothetical protein
MFDHMHDDPRAKGQLPDADRNVKIERLLLAGLDHYFQGDYERAIDVWSRVLFLDRSHARARAYIDRARAGLAERLRESEELVHTGVEAFERGDVGEARSLLMSAVERGGGRDEALTVLERLNRLEAAAGDVTVSLPELPSVPAGGRGKAAHVSLPGRRVRVVPLVLFTFLLVAGGYLAVSWGQWETLLFGPAPSRTVTPVADLGDPLPVPSGAEVVVARARRLIDARQFHSALAVLDSVVSGDPLESEANALRASIQRRLLFPQGPSELGPQDGVPPGLPRR